MTNLLRGWIVIDAFAIAMLIVFVATRIGSSEAVDAHVYWTARVANLYPPGSTSGDQSFQYPPILAQVIAPATLLPFPAFHAVWLTLLVASLAWLVGPLLALLLIVVPVTNVLAEVVIGNIHVLIAASIIVGLRWPAAWAFPALTKVTPGIGILWFIARREWRAAGIAVIATALVVIMSYVLAPQAWLEWLSWLTNRPEPPPNPDQLLPWAVLPVRLLVSSGLILFAAPRNWTWLLPLAIWLSLPIIWYNSLVILAATIPLAWHAFSGQLEPFRRMRPAAARLLMGRP